MKKKTLSILNRVKNGKITPEQAQKKLFDLFHIEENYIEEHYCNPPNLTYCKQAIYPEFDCTKCKWVIKNKEQK